MPARLVRFQQCKQFHFITFSCHQRKPLLRTDLAKQTAERILEQVRKERRLCIAAYVLMPEHVHLLADEPLIGTLAGFLQVFKQLTARELKSPEHPSRHPRKAHPLPKLIPHQNPSSAPYSLINKEDCLEMNGREIEHLLTLMDQNITSGRAYLRSEILSYFQDHESQVLAELRSAHKVAVPTSAGEVNIKLSDLQALIA